LSGDSHSQTKAAFFSELRTDHSVVTEGVIRFAVHQITGNSKLALAADQSILGPSNGDNP
jgi:hypothetical protein